jgi:predicted RNA-binding protein YlxR (DUF448 family)
VRIVVSESKLEIDEGFTAPGRGAYLHHGQECLATAIRRRALQRALHVRQPVSEEALRAKLHASLSANSSGAVE